MYIWGFSSITGLPYTDSPKENLIMMQTHQAPGRVRQRVAPRLDRHTHKRFWLPPPSWVREGVMGIFSQPQNNSQGDSCSLFIILFLSWWYLHVYYDLYIYIMYCLRVGTACSSLLIALLPATINQFYLFRGVFSLAAILHLSHFISNTRISHQWRLYNKWMGDMFERITPPKYLISSCFFCCCCCCYNVLFSGK